MERALQALPARRGERPFPRHLRPGDRQRLRQPRGRHRHLRRQRRRPRRLPVRQGRDRQRRHRGRALPAPRPRHRDRRLARRLCRRRGVHLRRARAGSRCRGWATRCSPSARRPSPAACAGMGALAHQGDGSPSGRAPTDSPPRRARDGIRIPGRRPRRCHGRRARSLVSQRDKTRVPSGPNNVLPVRPAYGRRRSPQARAS